MTMTVKDQRRFLRRYKDMDARIRRGQAPTLEDREMIHTALVIMRAVLSANFSVSDEAPQV